MRNVRRACEFYALFGVMFAAGCGSPNVYPVTGEVLVMPEGVVVPGGIEFRPIGQSAEHIAEGIVGDDGKFTLITRGVGRGAVPGEYQAILAPTTPDDFDGVPLAQQQRMLEPIDRKYRDYDTTPLRFTVTTDAVQNHFHIEVERPKKRGARR